MNCPQRFANRFRGFKFEDFILFPKGVVEKRVWQSLQRPQCRWIKFYELRLTAAAPGIQYTPVELAGSTDCPVFNAHRCDRAKAARSWYQYLPIPINQTQSIDQCKLEFPLIRWLHYRISLSFQFHPFCLEIIPSPPPYQGKIHCSNDKIYRNI